MRSKGDKSIHLFLILLLGEFMIPISGQERFPVPGIFFTDHSVARVDISIHPDSLAEILSPGNEGSDHEYMATFTFSRDEFTESIDSVGFRLRGNTSRRSQKKSFKVSMNTFIRGQQFMGVEKINLNGEHNDPSIARAHFSWYLFRNSGVPASRSGHVELYINGEYKGLYLNVEHVDEEFVELRFGNNNGNLYKCLWPADLVYLGSSPDLYKFENNGRQAYELKTNLQENDYSDLARLVDVVNNHDPEDFPSELNLIFNVNIFLKALAVEILLGHWDNYAYLKNNYYLYHNEGTDKIEYIPYDTDNTFGISWFAPDWATRDVYNWTNEGESRPLVERVLQNSIYKDRFTFYMNRMIQEVYNPEHLDLYINSIRSRIMGYVPDDIYRTLDYGFTYDDFYNSFDDAWGNHVTYGIKPFVSVRSSSALEQLNLNPVDPIITLLNVNRPDPGDAPQVEFLVEDDNDIEEVKIWFSNGGDFVESDPVDVGYGLFSMTYEGSIGLEGLRFYLTAKDSESNISRDPVEGWYTIVPSINPIRKAEQVNSITLHIYPNPARAFLTIDLPGGERTMEYRIYDATGRVRMTGTSEINHFTLDFEQALDDGFYLLEIKEISGTNAGSTYISRFIISK